MAKKTRVVTDDKEALELLGINSPEAPGGEAVETAKPEQTAEEEPKAVETATQQELGLEKEGKVVSSTQNEDGTIKEEETERRTWQAEADKAKTELAKKDQQILNMQEQNRQLLNVITPLQQKYQEPVQQQAEPTKPKADFIVDGFFDPEKFAKYEQERDLWMAKNLESNITSNMQKKNEEQSTKEQLQKVAEEFPEYVNSLTGEVDINRVKADLQKYTSNKTIADLLRDSKGLNKAKDTTLAESLQAIDKNADRPQSVAASIEATPEKKEVPENLKKLVNTFGGLELPPNYGGMEK